MNFNSRIVLRYSLNFAASAYFTELAGSHSIAQRLLYARVTTLTLVCVDLDAYQEVVAFVEFLSAHSVAWYLGPDSRLGQGCSRSLSDGIELWEFL